MDVGLTVTRLSITPVKGLTLHHPDTIELTRKGPVGDRVFYLVDDAGKIESCTRNPGLYGLRARFEDATGRLEVSRGRDVLHSATVEPATAIDTDMWGLRTITSDVVADPTWSNFFSDIVGRRVRLVRARGSAFDVKPASLLGAASVHELARRAGRAAIDSGRFRMLIEFSGAEAHVEDSWLGRLVEVGDTLLRVSGPVKRCAATTRDPESGAVNLQTLRMITAYRGRRDSALGPGATFGVYADVLEPGTISVGDAVTAP